MMKKTILLFAAGIILVFNSLQAQVFKTIHVETPGTLSSLLTYEDRSTVTNLTLTGNINRNDLNTLQSQMFALTSIDLYSTYLAGDSIGAGSFNQYITSIVLPASLKRIGVFAFASCNNLDSLTIPPSVNSIGDYAFASCRSLKSIVIPGSVSSLGNLAFVSCDSLTTVIFLPGLSRIKEYTFAGCTSLKSVTLSNTITSIGKLAFVSCNALSDITLPASLDSVSMLTFASCNGLTSLTIPAHVMSIGQTAFVNCQNLESLTFESTPTGITIGYAGFAGCSKLSSINFPYSSVTSIGRFGFAACSIRDSLILPASLTSIGQGAFQGCTNLVYLVIPSTVDTIGNNAFSGCSGLKEVRVNRAIPMPLPWDSYVFSGMYPDSVVLFVPAGSKSAYQAADGWKDFSNISEFDFHLTASRDTIFLSDTTGSFDSFAISGNTEWAINANQDWLLLNKTLGMDNDSIVITALENQAIQERKAELTISGLAIAPRTLVIIQAPKPALEVTPNSLTIDKQANSDGLLVVNSNISWVVSSSQDWLQLSHESGNGNVTVALSAEANPYPVMREATVVFMADRVIPDTVIITQDPKLIILLSANTMQFGASAGSTNWLAISSNTNWIISTNQPWLSISQSSGFGNDTVVFTAGANTGIINREAMITVLAEDVDTLAVMAVQGAAGITGITETKASAIEVYPNPLVNNLIIEQAAGYEISLFDLNGHLMLSKIIDSEHEVEDLSSLSLGLYLVRIGNRSWKIMKTE
jgi:hypothetical protein